MAEESFDDERLTARADRFSLFLARTDELLEQGAELSALSRAAADDVAGGRPVPRVAERLARWSDDASAHLAAAESLTGPQADLVTLAARLTKLIAQAATAEEAARKAAADQERRREDALRGARLLHEKGLHTLIPGMLGAAGVDVADWEAVLTQEALAEEASRPAPEVEVAPESEGAPRQPGPAPQPPGARTLPQPEPDVVYPVSAEAEDGAQPPEEEGLEKPGDDRSALIASLIREGRDALAVCVSQAVDEAPARQRLLRFFCGAFSCSPEALELQLPDLSLIEDEVERLGADDSRLLLATALRVGLSVGYSPVDPSSLTDQADFGHGGLRRVAEAAAEVIKHGYQRDAGTTVMQHADAAKNWATFGPRATGLRDTLAHRKVSLQRASNILRHMVRKDQPVGRALVLVAGLAEAGPASAVTATYNGTWAHVDRIALDLTDAGARNGFIDDADKAVSSQRQLREHIVGNALAKLDGSLCEARDLLRDFLADRTAIRMADTQDFRSGDNLVRALDSLPEPLEAGAWLSAGDSAMRRLVEWLRAGARPTAGTSVNDLVAAALEPLYEIPRDESGSPLRSPTLAEVDELLEGRDRVTVVRGYLTVGNLAEARAIAAALDEPAREALNDEMLRAARDLREQHGKSLEAVNRVAARLRAVNDDDMARELAVKANQQRETPGERFDLTIGALTRLADEGNARLTNYREDLRKRARACHCSEADRQRILDLIDREDEILAVEFLTMAEAGRSLEDPGTRDGDDFGAFFPALVNVAVSARDHRDPVTAVREAAGATVNPAHRQLAFGLNAWRELKRRKRGLQEIRFRECVADVLRMLGLVPRNQTWLREISRTQRSGYATFQVRATPIDRSYVPSFGTQANGDYDLTIVWDAVTPARLLDFIDVKRRTRPNIIVYFNTLDPGQRVQLRRLTSHHGGKGFSPLVVDDAVAGWLSTLAEPGWRFTQRVTLPFASINPYTPFAGGEVPDEVFVGREQEREQIESPTGSMFVYGGRQLGKSAVLRRVERMFTDDWELPRDSKWHARAGRLAIYLDLNASIGGDPDPSALWTVLSRRLREANVIPPEQSRKSGPPAPAGPDGVIQRISAWLDADDGNRLLLLLDEADNFLTADSQGLGSDSGAEFPTLQRLKGLMEQSGRRFKAVFAGLHQVQRFHDSSNTPVAHGGEDILIGPLATMDAYRLVVDPMNALGYEFASPDLVWRLLLFANYQASLVQIVCAALVPELSRKQLPASGGHILVTADDIEAVVARSDVRDLIVQRFWWTISLDPRYRVIALVVGLLSLDSAPGETFAQKDLQELAEDCWPAGFAGGQITSKEFRRYLDEMVGLGVLYRHGEQHGLRSPNILSLLGTRQKLEESLGDAHDLEVPYEYNPTMSRRILGASTDLSAPRSPLTDRDVASLLDLDGQRHGRIQLVTGSNALTIDRVTEVIRSAAEDRQVRCEVMRGPGEISARVKKDSTHVVVDLSGHPGVPGDLPVLYSRLSESGRVTATIIIGPSALPIKLEGVSDDDVIAVRRWSVEGLKSWHESPFTTGKLRKRLHRVTSGWPLLVEETMRQITNGKAPMDALDLICRQLADPAFAREHLTACGADLETVVRWASTFTVEGDDGLCEAFPASVEELSGVFDTEAAPVLEKLEALDVAESTPDGWVLDRVVCAAAATLAG